MRDLLAYARKLQTQPAVVDYFATSLPTMLLFADDLQLRQETTALFLQAQAHLGLGGKARALLHGRYHVTTQDIAALAKPVLRHRLICNFAAQAGGLNTDIIIDRLVEHLNKEVGS